MPKRPANTLGDLRGGVKLAVDALHGVTGIAEAMHQRLAGAVPLGRLGRAAGIDRATQMVYRGVRGTARLVGQGLDATLAGLEGLPPGTLRGVPQTLDGPARDALVAALNGVLGDHLERTANPLAIRMQLQRREQRFPAAPLPLPGPHVLLLIHGLCLNDRQWTRGGHDHGQALSQALGLSPVYAHYNSGLHISDNGRQMAAQLEQLLQNWPVTVQALTIIGHGMGGLVARSAVHQATQDNMRWPRSLRSLVFLGTPHHGAPLERGGNWLNRGLLISPYAAPFARLGALRSAGITDLQHGNLLEEDRGHEGSSAPLPAGVDCYAIAGALAPLPEPEAQPPFRSRRSLAARLLPGQWLGDGLVPVASALGCHREAARDLHIPPSHTWVGRGTHHLDLLASARVCQQLRHWLAN